MCIFIKMNKGKEMEKEEEQEVKFEIIWGHKIVYCPNCNNELSVSVLKDNEGRCLRCGQRLKVVEPYG